jgi:hypothetical protein
MHLLAIVACMHAFIHTSQVNEPSCDAAMLRCCDRAPFSTHSFAVASRRHQREYLLAGPASLQVESHACGAEGCGESSAPSHTAFCDPAVAHLSSGRTPGNAEASGM